MKMHHQCGHVIQIISLILISGTLCTEAGTSTMVLTSDNITHPYMESTETTLYISENETVTVSETVSVTDNMTTVMFDDVTGITSNDFQISSLSTESDFNFENTSSGGRSSSSPIATGASTQPEMTDVSTINIYDSTSNGVVPNVSIPQADGLSTSAPGFSMSMPDSSTSIQDSLTSGESTSISDSLSSMADTSTSVSNSSTPTSEASHSTYVSSTPTIETPTGELSTLHSESSSDTPPDSTLVSSTQTSQSIDTTPAPLWSTSTNVPSTPTTSESISSSTGHVLTSDGLPTTSNNPASSSSTSETTLPTTFASSGTTQSTPGSTEQNPTIKGSEATAKETTTGTATTFSTTFVSSHTTSTLESTSQNPTTKVTEATTKEPTTGTEEASTNTVSTTTPIPIENTATVLIYDITVQEFKKTATRTKFRELVDKYVTIYCHNNSMDCSDTAAFMLSMKANTNSYEDVIILDENIVDSSPDGVEVTFHILRSAGAYVPGNIIEDALLTQADQFEAEFGWKIRVIIEGAGGLEDWVIALIVVACVLGAGAIITGIVFGVRHSRQSSARYHSTYTLQNLYYAGTGLNTNDYSSIEIDKPVDLGAEDIYKYLARVENGGDDVEHTNEDMVTTFKE